MNLGNVQRTIFYFSTAPFENPSKMERYSLTLLRLQLPNNQNFCRAQCHENEDTNVHHISSQPESFNDPKHIMSMSTLSSRVLTQMFNREKLKKKKKKKKKKGNRPSPKTGCPPGNNGK